jgi:hypothetical protein
LSRHREVDDAPACEMLGPDHDAAQKEGDRIGSITTLHPAESRCIAPAACCSPLCGRLAGKRLISLCFQAQKIDRKGLD